MVEDASFTENTPRTELAYDCNSGAINLSVPYSHSTLLSSTNSTAVDSTLPPLNLKYSSTYYQKVRYIENVSLAVTFLFGIIGNALVLYVVGYVKKKRNSEDVYVQALASADFITSLMATARRILAEIRFTCDRNCYNYIAVIPGILNEVTATASAGILVLISLNRYR